MSLASALFLCFLHRKNKDCSSWICPIFPSHSSFNPFQPGLAPPLPETAPSQINNNLFVAKFKWEFFFFILYLIWHPDSIWLCRSISPWNTLYFGLFSQRSFPCRHGFLLFASLSSSTYSYRVRTLPSLNLGPPSLFILYQQLKASYPQGQASSIIKWNKVNFHFPLRSSI